MNPMQTVDVVAINRINDRTVEFVIDASRYPYLTADLVTFSMNDFQDKYRKNVSGWSAHMAGTVLSITVVGNINWDANPFKE